MACSSIASDELNEINHNETICVASYLAKLKAEGYKLKNSSLCRRQKV